MRLKRILLILSVFLIIGFYSWKITSVVASPCDALGGGPDGDCDQDGTPNKDDDDCDGDGLYDDEEVDSNSDGDFNDPGESDPGKCDTDGDGIPDGLDKAYGEITEILTKVGAALGVLMIAVEGVRWIFSDSPKGRDDARKGVTYVIIGLILLISAEKLVEYLLGGMSGLCICGV